MRVFLALAALGLGLSTGPASTANSEGPKAAAGDKIVCKQRRQTGTRFTKKTCKTVAEWEAIAENHRAGLKELVDRPQIKVCGPNGCD